MDKALKEVISLCAEGATILELCKAGDAKVESEVDKVYNKKGTDKVSKGLAYPTCVSVNGVISNLSPLPSDKEQAGVVLKSGDLVKIQVGAHIDGYASIAGESLVIGGKDAILSDIKADLIQAAYQASEIALRSARPGAKNWEITAGISKILEEYKEKTKVRGIEGASTNANSFGWKMMKDDIQAKKTITPFPTSEQRRDSDNTHSLEEGEVYCLMVAVTNADDPKVGIVVNILTASPWTKVYYYFRNRPKTPPRIPLPFTVVYRRHISSR